MWGFFQIVVAFAAGCAMIYATKNHGFPDNGYGHGLLAIGAAWLATHLLGWLIDLPSRIRNYAARRKQGRESGATGWRKLV